jgi:hypothetical protein
MDSFSDTLGKGFGSLAQGAGSFGSAASDLFTASGDRSKATGDLMEAGNYDLAAQQADREAFFTKESTAIQAMQSERATYQSMSQTKADIGGAGFAASGSGLDILAESASQGALQRAVIERQGLITEQGYEEQAESYRNMESAADMVASGEKKAAGGADWAAGIQGVAGLLQGGKGIMTLAALL